MEGFSRLERFVAVTVALLVLGVLFLGAYLWSVPYDEAASVGSGVGSFKELSDRFADIARNKGGLYAYEVLRRADLPPDTDFHLLGHTVGEILYTQRGVAGIADCTQDFRNACSHTMVIGVLQEFGTGEETLRLIDTACRAAPGGSGAYTMCYHGLGHGVFAYFGYDLVKTDAFCKKMGTSEYHDQQYTECVGGSIMELMGGGGHDREKWTLARQKYLTADPLAPCTNSILSLGAKGYCYIYITPRLLELAGAQLARPDPATFPKAFSFCNAIPAKDQKLRDSCFGGFGKEFVPLAGERDIRFVDRFSDQQYSLAASWCVLSEPYDGKRACIGQALESVFWGGENDPVASFRFCAVVQSDLQDACYKKLGNNIQRYLAGTIRERWCNELAEDYRDVCKVGALPLYE